jgi:DNA-binding LacI/PurR family transcriptional regulator
MVEGHSVTMADVAALAGGTPQEVALVLAADTRVPADLRQRIHNAVQNLGYRPLAAIQSGRSRPLRLAIVFKTYRGDDPEANRFYTPIASAIALACVKQGTTVAQEFMTVNDKYDLIELPQALLDGRYDAAFLVGSQLNAGSVAAIREICPVVLIDGYSHNDSLDAVVTDNGAGGRAAVEHLIAAGHRDIALLGSEPVCYPSIQGRRTGYVEALTARNLSPHYIDASYVQTDEIATLGVDYVKRNPSVSAVFGVNDLITVAFMQLARFEGIRFPTDLSLVGFDDLDIAGLVIPALTTLSVDRTQMGRAGFALMAHRLESPEADRVEAVVTPALVERDSVAAPRRRR